MRINGMEVKRRINLELIVKGKKEFEAIGEFHDIVLENKTKIYWKNQKPDYEKFGITLAGHTETLEQTYRLMSLAIGAKSYRDKPYEIKIIVGGRKKNDCK